MKNIPMLLCCVSAGVHNIVELEEIQKQMKDDRYKTVFISSPDIVEHRL